MFTRERFSNWQLEVQINLNAAHLSILNWTRTFPQQEPTKRESLPGPVSKTAFSLLRFLCPGPSGNPAVQPLSAWDAALVGESPCYGFCQADWLPKMGFLPLFQHVFTHTSECVRYIATHISIFLATQFKCFAEKSMLHLIILVPIFFLSNKRQKHNNCIPANAGFF